jgi:phosphohistidine phosphatase SixA
MNTTASFCPLVRATYSLRLLIGTTALFVALLTMTWRPAVASETGAIWQALRSGGHVALLRHAVAPGTGDPPGFVLDDCGTQRNLSAAGREQARRIGQLFRANGIGEAKIFSSQWCRCLETAQLLQLGAVRELPALNSFFNNFQNRDRQTSQVRAWLAEQNLAQPLLLVTHQVNITDLTGVYPSSGELVVIRHEGEGRLSVVGTLETD